MKIVTILVFSVCLVTSRAAGPPDADVVAKTAIELWKAKKIPELGRYLTSLEHAFPNRLSSVIGSAFMDDVYRSDYDATRAKFNRIIVAVNSKQIAVPDGFRLILGTNAYALGEIDKAMANVGISKEQKKLEANPSQIREFYGSRLPDLLILLQLAPNADLP